ncbi:MAG: nicotinate-nucleotide--dimethylbenzimidazole phosphoribosyltransferase [Acidobacteriota bacterium]
MSSPPSLAEIEAHLDHLTKPPGSLGRLERLAARLCHILGTLQPETRPRRLCLFAGDHGVAAAGVTEWPSEVTGLMIANIVGGGAASSALAASSKTELEVIDVGSLSEPLAEVPGYLCRKVRSGTRDLTKDPALTIDEWRQAAGVGRERARSAADAGCRVVAAGEMGIGNTTPSACLAMLLADVPLEGAVGRGAGAGDETFARKQRIVRDAVERARRPLATRADNVDLETAIAAVGGLEIAAMAGFFTEAHRLGLAVVLDGVIATAAALAAERLVPGVRASLIAAHRGVEPAHGAMLDVLELEPMLDWELRLGEGTGALLLMPLLDAAAAMVREMATFGDLELAGPGTD